MLIKNLKDCEEFIGKDKTTLREILHPKNDNVPLSCSLAYAKLKPGDSSLPHRLRSIEIYFILKGKGVMHINDELKDVGKDCAVYIPSLSVQFIKNTGSRELEFLCIVAPPWYSRDEEII